MEDAEPTQSSPSLAKQLGLVVGGVLVVAGLVVLLKGVGSTAATTKSAVIGSATEKPVVAVTNLAKKEDPVVENQKLTVEQKLKVTAPTESVDTSKKYTVTLKTSLGDIVFALDAETRPKTVSNFVYLARLGFYDGVIFHRVINGFMIQGGDPLGTGTGGPAYKFADELTAPNSNAKGTISMANAGPNTNGSQFFINLVDNRYLDTKHTVFGKVVSGMDVVENIGKTPVDQTDRPITPVVIDSAEVSRD
jgi:peptidylprolyl isomerase